MEAEAEAAVGTRPPRAAESAAAAHLARLGRTARLPLGGAGPAGRVAGLSLAERPGLWPWPPQASGYPQPRGSAARAVAAVS